jgi:transcription elongation factor GreA
MFKEGIEKLTAELELLKNRRGSIIQAISTAREHGDLKENAEYHAAREEQGMDEARISYLESKLAGVQIIDPEKIPKDKIYLGSTFKVYEFSNDRMYTYTLVNEDEAINDKNYLSNTSPMGKAFLNKEPGDVVQITVPRGVREFEVDSIV